MKPCVVCQTEFEPVGCSGARRRLADEHLCPKCAGEFYAGAGERSDGGPREGTALAAWVLQRLAPYARRDAQGVTK